MASKLNYERSTEPGEYNELYGVVLFQLNVNKKNKMSKEIKSQERKEWHRVKRRREKMNGLIYHEDHLFLPFVFLCLLL